MCYINLYFKPLPGLTTLPCLLLLILSCFPAFRFPYFPYVPLVPVFLSFSLPRLNAFITFTLSPPLSLLSSLSRCHAVPPTAVSHVSLFPVFPSFGRYIKNYEIAVNQPIHLRKNIFKKEKS